VRLQQEPDYNAKENIMGTQCDLCTSQIQGYVNCRTLQCTASAVYLLFCLVMVRLQASC